MHAAVVEYDHTHLRPGNAVATNWFREIKNPMPRRPCVDLASIVPLPVRSRTGAAIEIRDTIPAAATGQLRVAYRETGAATRSRPKVPIIATTANLLSCKSSLSAFMPSQEAGDAGKQPAQFDGGRDSPAWSKAAQIAAASDSVITNMGDTACVRQAVWLLPQGARDRAGMAPAGSTEDTQGVLPLEVLDGECRYTRRGEFIPGV